MDSEPDITVLLVIASRKFTDTGMMRAALGRLQEPGRFLAVVHGGNEGGEKIARLWAQERQALGEPVSEEECGLQEAFESADRILVGLVATARNKRAREGLLQAWRAQVPWALVIQR